MEAKKPKVVFEQYVIPHYRVPFFSLLAKKIDLVVVASQNSKPDGVLDVLEDQPFKNLRLPEDMTGFHPDIFDVIKEEKPDVFISYDNSLIKIFSEREKEIRFRTLDVKSLWMGCDGYWVSDLEKEKWSRLAPWRFRQWPKLLKDSVAIPGVDGFVCHSNYMADYFGILFRVPKKKIFLAHNAIETRVFEKYATNNISLKSGRGIVFVGRLTQGKNIEALLRVYKMIEARFSDAFLTIIGEGSMRGFLEGYSLRLGLKNCKFMGAIYDDEGLAENILPHVLGVLPGLGGLGINTLMACGLPVVAGKADGTGLDLIENGVNGYLFNNKEKDLFAKLITALANRDELIKMGKNSLLKIRDRFSLESMVNGYINAIENVKTQNS